MIFRWLSALAWGVLASTTAASQTISSDVQKYLNLTDAQVQSINDLNRQFGQYFTAQQSTYGNLESDANAELSKDAPDPAQVGGDYAQMEMIQRDFSSQRSQLQSKVAAVLTADQAMRVAALLNVERLQPLVSEAGCVYLEPQRIAASFTGFLLGVSSTNASACQPPSVPIALSNYLNLSDGQIVAIENAIRANEDYVSRQSLKISELQNDIADLTAAQSIDSAALGADYVAIRQIQRDESAQPARLMTTIRSLITDQQQPQLQALDNAEKLFITAGNAAANSILVLPPDLCPSTTTGLPYLYFNPLYLIFNPSFPANSCGAVIGVTEGTPQIERTPRRGEPNVSPTGISARSVKHG